MAADDNEHSSIASTSNGSSSPVTNSPSSSAVVGPKKRGILDVDALWRKKKILELKNKQIEEKNQQDNENERPKESEEKAAAGQAMRQPIPTRSNAAEKRKSARIAHQREMEGRIQDESMDGKTIKHTVLRSRTVYPKLPDSPG
ncbi:unnamed protein product [Caenorhabditis auriculariae]|uniref:Uncharacterized protein n=1 Tax=Caenorhabditis auriculariae TaxID=2777116 RepID=A0A8S1H782_9PELO|nr:unnamed protein product [Caenorhabditis auriculariae]